MTPQRPFLLALDLDGVCADFTFGMRLVWARANGLRPADLPPPTDYGFSDWGMTPERYRGFISEAVRDSRLLAELNPIRGAIGGIRRIAARDDVNLMFVTARAANTNTPDLEIAQTAEWLHRHKLLTCPVHFTADKNTVEYDLLIDDSPSNVEKAVEAGRNVWLFDQPYNKHVVDVPRITNWRQLENRLATVLTNRA